MISPVDRLGDNGRDYVIGKVGAVGKIAQMLFDELPAIQTGKIPDPFGWVNKIV